MTLVYDAAADGGALRQGEILGPVWQHHPEFPPRKLPENSQVLVRSRLRDLVVVLSSDCDLSWDYEMRFMQLPEEPQEIEQDPNAVTEVLLCELHNSDEFRPRFVGKSKLWERIKGKHDQRYHVVSAAPITPVGITYLSTFYLDFKKVFSLTTEDLYDGILAGDIERVARMPVYELHELIDRFYGYLSRVAVP